MKQMKQWSLIGFILLFSTLFISSNANANPNTISMWGYSGIINVPNAKIMSFGDFRLGTNYFIRYGTLAGAAHFGAFPGLEIGAIAGLPPIQDFNGLVGDIKYQLIQPSEQNPLSVAIGGLMLGAPDKYNNFVMANNLYLVLSHDFKWQFADGRMRDILSGHIGFSGNTEGARIMAALEVPIMNIVNISAEYLGRTQKQADYTNFGVKVTPLPFLTVAVYALGIPDKTFFDREYAIGLTYFSTLPFEQVKESKKNENKFVKPTASSSPIQSVIVSPPPLITASPASDINTPGTIKGQVVDSTNKGIVNAMVTLQNKESKKSMEIENTISNGNFQFENVPDGEYQLVVSKDGFNEHEKDIIIKSGKTTDIIFSLSPKKIEIKKEIKNTSDTTTEQGKKGIIKGTILSADKTPISGVRIMIESNDITIMTISGPDGTYTLRDLPDVRYTLTVSKTGFKTDTLFLSLEKGQELKQDIQLKKE